MINVHEVADLAAELGLSLDDLAEVVLAPKSPAKYRRRLVVAPVGCGAKDAFLRAGFRHRGLPGKDVFWMEVAR